MKPIKNPDPFAIGQYVLVTYRKWKGERKIIDIVPCEYATPTCGCSPVLGYCGTGGNWLVLQISSEEEKQVDIDHDKFYRNTDKGSGVLFCYQCLNL
jgi:hypothetical protein